MLREGGGNTLNLMVNTKINNDPKRIPQIKKADR